MSRLTFILLIAVILSAAVVALLRHLIFPGAHWWPIMMIGVLLGDPGDAHLARTRRT